MVTQPSSERRDAFVPTYCTSVCQVSRVGLEEPENAICIILIMNEMNNWPMQSRVDNVAKVLYPDVLHVAVL